MNFIKNFVKFSFFVILACSCSNFKKQENQVDTKNEKKNEKLNESKIVDLKKAEKDLETRMSILRDDALKSGPEAVRYLATDLFIKGNDAAIRGDSQTAAFLFNQVHRLSPNDSYIKKKYAVELVRLGKIEEARPLFKSLFAEDSSDESVALILGGIYTSLEDKLEARKVYSKLLSVHPKSEEACVFLSKSYGLEGNYKKAYNLLSKCEKRSPKKGIYSYYKGKMAVLQKKKELAKKFFHKSLKADPSYHQSAIALGLMQEEKKQFSLAIKTYKKFLKKTPLSFPILSRLVQVMFSNQVYDGIIEYAERLSSLDPSDLNLKVRLGILYTDQKRFSDAKGTFKEILSEIPNSDRVLYYLGSLHQQTEEFDIAVTYFAKINEESTLYSDSSIQIAQLLQQMALKGKERNKKLNEQKLIEYITSRSEKKKELEVELKLTLATFYESKKKFHEAIDVLGPLRKEKKYTEGHDYYLASLYEKIDKFTVARNIILEILQKNPKNAQALNFLGYSFLENGNGKKDFDKAYGYITQALSFKPDDGYIRDSLGWYYFKVGRYNDALREIKKAWSLVKDDSVIVKHLAIVYQELRKYGEAKKYYLEALKHCKVESERAEVLKAIDQLESKRLPASGHR